MAKGEFLGAEKVGALEARWSTRNAFTGHKDNLDMRSQHIANPKEELKAFTPQDLRNKEELVGLAHGPAFKRAKQAEENQRLIDWSRQSFQDAMRADLRMQAEPQIWAAYDKMIGKTGREQILKAIEAKVGQAEAVQATALEKVQATAEIQAETAKLLTQVPAEVALVGAGAVALWLINRLPINGMLKIAGIGVIFSIILSACSGAAPTPVGEVPNPSAPVATEVGGMPTQEAAAPANTVTAEPSPTATEVVMTFDQKIDAFMNGSIEFPSDLSPEEYKAFIAGMNERRGADSVWISGVDKNQNPVTSYYDVAKNKMVELKGTYEQNKQIIDANVIGNTFVELYQDAAGNLQYVNPDTGELVTVPNSAGVDWNMVVNNTNYQSGLIDFPTDGLPSPLGGTATGLFDLVVGGKHSNPDIFKRRANVLPVVLVDNTPVKLASVQGGLFPYSCLEMLFIRTDESGKPTYAVKVLVGPQSRMSIGEEGKKMDMTIGNEFGPIPDTAVLEKLVGGSIYYVALTPDQEDIWQEMNRSDIDKLEGVDSEADAYNAATSDPTPDEIIVLTSQFIIKKK